MLLLFLLRADRAMALAERPRLLLPLVLVWWGLADERNDPSMRLCLCVMGWKGVIV